MGVPRLLQPDPAERADGGGGAVGAVHDAEVDAELVACMSADTVFSEGSFKALVIRLHRANQRKFDSVSLIADSGH